MPLYPGDPLTPGVGATAGRQAAAAQGGDDADEDPGAADLLRRRAAAAARARRPGGAGGLARRAADHLPPRPGPGQGAPEAGVRLEARRRSTTSSRRCRAASCPTSGSCAATTTTPGSTAPPIRSAAWSRCWRRRARSASWRKAGWRPKRTHRLRRLGRRGAGPARLDRVGRGRTPTSCSEKAVVYINSDMQRRAASSASAARTRCERFVNEVARDVADPENGGQRRRARCAPAPIAERHAGGAHGGCATARPVAIDALGSGSDYTPVPAAPRHRLAQHRLRRRGRLRPVPLDLRLVRPLHALLRPRLRLRRGAGEGRRAASCCGWPTPTCCRSSSRALAAAIETLRRRGAEARRHDARPRRRSTTGASTTASTTLAADPTRGVGGAEAAGRRCRTSTSRRCRTRSSALTQSAARRYDAKAGAAVAAGAAGARDAAANGVLLTAERALTRRTACPRRPWYRHQVYAPGFYTGYGVKTLPAVREAIEQRNWAEATAQIPKVAAHDRALRRGDREGRRPIGKIATFSGIRRTIAGETPENSGRSGVRPVPTRGPTRRARPPAPSARRCARTASPRRAPPHRTRWRPPPACARARTRSVSGAT